MNTPTSTAFGLFCFSDWIVYLRKSLHLPVKHFSSVIFERVLWGLTRISADFDKYALAGIN
jgi:hypothetical protein